MNNTIKCELSLGIFCTSCVILLNCKEKYVYNWTQHIILLSVNNNNPMSELNK